MRSLMCCQRRVDFNHNHDGYVNSSRELLIYAVRRILEVGDVVMREERRRGKGDNARRAL